MALSWAVVGATKRGQEITWATESGTVVDLTGSTITGTIDAANGAVRAVTGTLISASPSTGKFIWTYSTADVADAGVHVVQFTATYVDGRMERTKPMDWCVYRELT